MIVQYASDIHQEFKSADIIPKLFKNIKADVLVLAGDICAMNKEEHFRKFVALITYYSPRYKYIFHVAGNHEYYALDDNENPKAADAADCMDAINRKLKALNKQVKNYLYLNCDTVTVNINGAPYTFIGATLWTKVSKKEWKDAEDRMNDYVYIHVNKKGTIRPFSIEDMQGLHAKHRLFIKKALLDSENQGIPTVLITHHKPISDTPAEKVTEYTKMYETEISNIFTPNLKAVIWGHTHKHHYSNENGVILTSNPKGYPSQHCGYRHDFGITL